MTMASANSCCARTTCTSPVVVNTRSIGGQFWINNCWVAAGFVLGRLGKRYGAARQDIFPGDVTIGPLRCHLCVISSSMAICFWLWKLRKVACLRERKIFWNSNQRGTRGSFSDQYFWCGCRYEVWGSELGKVARLREQHFFSTASLGCLSGKDICGVAICIKLGNGKFDK